MLSVERVLALDHAHVGGLSKRKRSVPERDGHGEVRDGRVFDGRVFHGRVLKADRAGRDHNVP